MKQLIDASQEHLQGTEHFVIDVGHEETRINFGAGHQIDDLMISSPDGDVFLSWDNEKFSSTNCLLLKGNDNLKEFNNVRCTKIHLMSKDDTKIIRVYVTIQRN